MLVLGLETSSLAGSVALLEDAALLGELSLPAGQRSAQSLIPTIDALLRQTGRRLADVRLIGVTLGPGSFTGLRVGVTAAKTLAYANGAEVLGVDTLETIAQQTPTHKPEGPARDATAPLGLAPAARLHVILDAQRQELFTARFRSSADARWTRETATAIQPVDAWLAELQDGDWVSGPAVERVASRLPAGVRVVPAELREPRSATVARLALNNYRAGRRDDLWKLAPAYYRPSAAEEKANRRK